MKFNQKNNYKQNYNHIIRNHNSNNINNLNNNKHNQSIHNN